jgi:hypothetical protein
LVTMKFLGSPLSFLFFFPFFSIKALAIAMGVAWKQGKASTQRETSILCMFMKRSTHI